MTNRWTPFFWSFLTAWLSASGVQAADLRVGERFPEIALPSLADGTPLSVADFRGRKLALHVWASW